MVVRSAPHTSCDRRDKKLNKTKLQVANLQNSPALPNASLCGLKLMATISKKRRIKSFSRWLAFRIERACLLVL